ncbi:MAG: beta-ketoacyl-ACP synthase II [Candidatus Cardinium sp.]|uniref:beta-ketoacyl-ACP synthase II n=1 Tax=Cardinium endosymbiont of Dermatophagoides farinae TaxID=2597823 RepID=UPI001183ECEA|nr:beta-ketoacyl-ACP synthase II [Cardinium endosymbiont of Dermatophagoides farinae]TSJ80575.1 beta-ketoacyl-ACP synthase II [Cardinium endosymbiont of Dermatophagoides farinae]UWW96564.1 MAG: beta-ketoacyl-ACP synthase II [Candidatus Cardinium sp.]
MLPTSVVITGLGALTPIGSNVEAYWNGLVSGQSGAAPITSFDTAKHKTKFACILKEYDPHNYLDAKDVRRMDPFAQYAMVAGDEAIHDAGLITPLVDKERVGVVWGSGIGGLGTIETTILEFFRNGMDPRINPFFIPKIIPDIPSGHLSIKYGFKGPNFATVAACASAVNAIVTAFQLIKLGDADVVVAGGSEAPIIQLGVAGFNALKALSTRNEDYLTASRPFDKTRDGFVMGEGAGALVLESYAHAQKRNAKIYAEVVGVGMSADAHHITAPDMGGVILALQRALASAGLSPEAIDYINAHGTSTPLGDVNEIEAIQHVFGAHAYKLNISSTKSMTGHLLGAAGAIESIATVLALSHQVVPPTINHKVLDEAIDPQINLTLHQAEKRSILFAQNNAFGFGGHNVSIIFKRWEDS